MSDFPKLDPILMLAWQRACKRRREFYAPQAAGIGALDVLREIFREANEAYARGERAETTDDWSAP